MVENTLFITVVVVIAFVASAVCVWVWLRYRSLLRVTHKHQLIEQLLESSEQAASSIAQEILEHVAKAASEVFRSDDACYWFDEPSRKVGFINLELTPVDSPLRQADATTLAEALSDGQPRLVRPNELQSDRSSDRPNILLVPVLSANAYEPRTMGGVALWWRQPNDVPSLSMLTLRLLGRWWGLIVDTRAVQRQSREIMEALQNFTETNFNQVSSEWGKTVLTLIVRSLQAFASARVVILYLHSPAVERGALITSGDDGPDAPLSWTSNENWCRALAPIVTRDKLAYGQSLKELFPDYQQQNIPEAPFVLVPLPADRREGAILFIHPQLSLVNKPELVTGLSLLTATTAALAEAQSGGESVKEPTTQTISRFLTIPSFGILSPQRIEVSWPAQGYVSFTKLLVKGELSESDLLTYLQQAATILAPLHNQNRALMLSPDSILVDPLAKTIKFIPYPVDRSLAFPYFEGLSAPEISRREFTPSSDVFFLGALVFFFYLGRFPSGDRAIQRILKNLYIPHPVGIDYLVKRAIWPSLSGRLTNASEFASLLNEILKRESNNPTALVSTIDVGADYNVGVHKGRNRGYQSQDNEDCLFWDCDPSQNLYFMAIADGVTRSDFGTGREAADILMRRLHGLWQAYVGKPQEIPKISDDLKRIFNNANEDIVSRVASYVEKNPRALASLYAMSTAACVAAIANRRAVIANVGNVRAYLVFGNCVAQLTQDDTPIAQAILDGNLPIAQAAALSSSELTQVVGLARMGSHGLEPVPLDIHLSCHDLRPGEALVLLSDGAFDCNNEERCFENELLKIVKTS
ncbi:hypothetical protein HKBW3S47_01425, partial [Candidatus Hakubella thermalkaliphila]